MSLHHWTPRVRQGYPLYAYPARCPLCHELMAWDRRFRLAWCVTKYCRGYERRLQMPAKETVA